MNDIFEYDVHKTLIIQSSPYSLFENVSRNPQTTIQDNVGIISDEKTTEHDSEVEITRYLTSYDTCNVLSSNRDIPSTISDQLTHDPHKLSGYETSKEFKTYDHYNESSDLISTKMDSNEFIHSLSSSSKHIQDFNILNPDTPFLTPGIHHNKKNEMKYIFTI